MRYGGLELRHFYHLWSDGDWEPVAAEHFGMLTAAGLDCDVTAGVTGKPAGRAAARRWLAREVPGVTFTEADSGWEEVTLRAVRGWARGQGTPAAVLYAHAKGSYHRGAFGDAWRRAMAGQVVTRWRQCVEHLSDGGADAAGCFWLTPGQYPDQVSSPYFAGNFWWARAGYLATLPEPAGDSRYEAELWLGRRDPRVADLRPGWPSMGLLAGEITAALNPGTT